MSFSSTIDPSVDHLSRHTTSTTSSSDAHSPGCTTSDYSASTLLLTCRTCDQSIGTTLQLLFSDFNYERYHIIDGSTAEPTVRSEISVPPTFSFDDQLPPDTDLLNSLSIDSMITGSSSSNNYTSGEIFSNLTSLSGSPLISTPRAAPPVAVQL